MESAVENVTPSVRRSTIESVESFEMNLKRVLLPTRMAGWISGYGIIEYPLGHPRSVISILYSLMIYGSILLLNTYIAYSILLKAIVERKNLSDQLFIIEVCMYTISTLSTVILYWANEKKIKSCLRRLAEIKMEMKQLGYNENYDRTVTIQTYEMVAVIIIMALLMLYTVEILLEDAKSWITVLQIATIWIILFFSLVNDLIFTNYVTFIEWEFVELRVKMDELFSRLEEKLSMENSNDSLEENAQDYCDSIKTTRRLHLNLVKLSRRVNNAYGAQILLSLITTTVMLIISVYNFLEIVKGIMNGDELTVKLIHTFVWCAFFAIKILAINLSCGRTMDEAAEIGCVIMKFNIEAINKRMELETRLFTMQLLQNPVKLTAQGFFDLGYSCILLVISIVTVYLCFLIQIEKPITNIGTSGTRMNNGITE